MSDNIRVLAPTIDAERASVIEALEDALAEARAGEVRSIGIAIVRPDQSLNTCWSDCDYAAPLVGACALLSKRLIAAIDE